MIRSVSIRVLFLLSGWIATHPAGFGPLASTRAQCPADSLDQNLSRQLPHVRSFVLKEGRLFMSLMADGGILEWARQE